MRGFIDDDGGSSSLDGLFESQSAFVRGFIDDAAGTAAKRVMILVSIRVRARLHR